MGQVRVLLQEVPSTLAALARKQRRRLGKIDIQLTVAETAKDEGNTRRMLRKLDQAANGLGRVERTFQRASTLPLTLGRQLRDATAAAIDQLEAFRAASGG